MAEQKTVLPSTPIPRALALIDALTDLRRDAWLSRTQVQALLAELRDHVPLALTIRMRRPKGVVTVSATKQYGETLTFRVNVRAKVLPG